tara:strand:+ start:14 stop:238 length:225 start_codon:yes stop_codon:yes gene_type:complete
MATKKAVKTAGLSDTIDAQENLQSQLDAFKETFLKECKQLEMSNVDLLNRMSELELLVDSHKAIIQRLKDRMGL